MTTATALLREEKREMTTDKFSADAAHFPADYRAEVLRGGVEIIEKISDEWTALCEEGACDEPFYRPEWFKVFVKNYENEIELLTIRRGGKLRAVLPLVSKKSSLHGVPVKKLAAVFNLQTQRFDLIRGADEAERAGIIKAIWNEIRSRKSWQVFELRLVKKDSWINDLLALAQTENYPTGIWQMDSAPFVTLPQGDYKEKLIADYLKNLSKNRRQLLKKKTRYLNELGAVEFAVTRGYNAELLEKYFALEAQSWKGRAGTAVTSDERAAKLHDEFAREIAKHNALFVHELKLDGKTIAMYLSIMFGRKTIGWKMSFDENYAKYSPGNLLFIEVINECLRNDSTELDQLSPATYNKSLWADGEYEHAAFYIFKRGLTGKMLNCWKFTIVKNLRKFKRNNDFAEAKNESN